MSQGLTGANVASGGGAPTDAKYIVQEPSGSLSAEQALSLLATGLLKNLTGTGVLSIAVEGTDYYKPTGTDVAVADGGTGASTAAAARSNLGIATNISRNAVINGNFDIWQRGTSFAAIASDTFFADRWQIGFGTSSVQTITRDTSVPTVAESGILSSYSMKLDITTADASIAAGDVNYIRNKIEGFDWKNLAQREFTLSFWVKSNLTGTNCVSFINGGFDRSYVAEYTINSANTWEKKTITVPASPSAGTWDYTNGIGIGVYFMSAVGSTYQTTAGSWQTGFFLGTSNQVNRLATIGNNLFIAQVQLEAGAVATDFAYRPFATELSLCQRYYEKNLPIETAPADGAAYQHPTVSNAHATTALTGLGTFVVPKRATPTVTPYRSSVVGSTAGRWAYLTLIGWTESTSTAVSDISRLGFSILVGGSGFTFGQAYSMLGNWTATAEI